MLTLGIEEAGRGPVVGPMIMCGVLIEQDKEDKLREIGAKDSKLLTPKRREELAKKIKKIIKDYKLVIIQPSEIDKAVSGEDGMNLNWLEAKKSAELINFFNPDKVILDCPSPNINAYVTFLRKYLKNKDLEIQAEHKAEKYPVVAASSILAKVTRDEEVKKIEKITGMSIGSGYVSNPVCQKFLKENFDKFPEIFRKSWISWKNHDEARKQKKIVDFETK